MREEPSARLAGLHVLVDDDSRWKRDPVEQARGACSGGAAVVQLRAKLAPDRTTLAWGRSIRVLTRSAGALFIVNDRFDLALAVGADGVHLGQGDLPASRLPESARRRLIVGLSTHDAAQARAARREPVDYVAFGPVFGTASKTSPYGARGLEALARAARIVAPLPLVAIGGIDSGSAGAAIAAGARAVAVISAVAAADDPVEATRALVSAMGHGA